MAPPPAPVLSPEAIQLVRWTISMFETLLEAQPQQATVAAEDEGMSSSSQPIKRAASKSNKDSASKRQKTTDTGNKNSGPEAIIIDCTMTRQDFRERIQEHLDAGAQAGSCDVSNNIAYIETKGKNGATSRKGWSRKAGRWVHWSERKCEKKDIDKTLGRDRPVGNLQSAEKRKDPLNKLHNNIDSMWRPEAKVFTELCIVPNNHPLTYEAMRALRPFYGDTTSPWAIEDQKAGLWLHDAKHWDPIEEDLFEKQEDAPVPNAFTVDTPQVEEDDGSVPIVPESRAITTHSKAASKNAGK